jgi:hypothetical protein
MGTQLVAPVSSRATVQVSMAGHSPASLHSSIKPHGWSGMHTGTWVLGSCAFGRMSQNWVAVQGPTPEQQ